MKYFECAKNCKGAYVLSNVSEYSETEINIMRRNARKDGLKTKLDKSTDQLFFYTNIQQLWI